jgi:DNA-binding GntR family transcriptional regulator
MDKSKLKPPKFETGKELSIRKVKRDTLFSDDAYISIKKMILDLKIVPKEILSESKLAVALGMSRTPVREALKRLSTEGLIISYGSKGYFLNVPTMKEIRDIYEVRIVLEGAITKSAAKNIDQGKLDYFEKQFISIKSKLNHKLENSKNSDIGNLYKERLISKIDNEFHSFLIESCDNEKMKEFMHNIANQLEISRVFFFFSYQGRRNVDPTRGKDIVDEHLRIIGALKKGDGEASKAFMEEHIRTAFGTLLQITLT